MRHNTHAVGNFICLLDVLSRHYNGAGSLDTLDEIQDFTARLNIQF